jgi:EthD domain
MVKVFLMLYRKPGLTREQFLEYWSGPHMRLAVRTAAATRLRRYVQNHPIQHPMTEALRQGRGAISGDYDGIVEAWWDSFEELEAVGNTAGEIAGALLEDELRFCDLPRSVMWFAAEHEFVAPTAAQD